jgi:hypothetical protein
MRGLHLALELYRISSSESVRPWSDCHENPFGLFNNFGLMSPVVVGIIGSKIWRDYSRKEVRNA